MAEREPSHIMVFIRKLGRPVFTTQEIVMLSGRSSSSVVQCLGRLERQGLLKKIYRGVWLEAGRGDTSVLDPIPQLFPRQRVYISFISALHLHGMVEQVPQVVTLAGLSHSRVVRTSLGVYSLHQLAPDIFDGFAALPGKDSVFMATPEKALVDSLYLSSRRKKQFGHFPELHWSSTFDHIKAREWVEKIPEKLIRQYVMNALARILPDQAEG